MVRLTPRSTRTATFVTNTTLFRSHAHMTGRKRGAAEAHGHFSGGVGVLQRQVDRRRLGKRGGRSGAHPVAPALLPAEQDRRRKRRRGRQRRLLPVKRAEQIGSAHV